MVNESTGPVSESGISGSSGADPPFKIELRADGGSRLSLQDDISVSVRITNTADEPIWMVGVVPGSDGLRYPLYVAEIKGPEGTVPVRLPEDLDYVRGLQSKDFVRLAPGQSFDPEGDGFITIQHLDWFKPTQPGKYRFRIKFDATNPDPRQWLGHTRITDRRKIEDLIRRVPPFRVWSNTLEIQFD